ncbi:MAG: 2-hydroxychromene-2-carboxylate isomerase [Burkholderiales bacterium]|nr:2-hydroxychromene-2-carboxylate isomerase [Burkholderiales bacterium]
MRSVEFFFDFSSPWTYMAFRQIEPLCRECAAQLVWKPFYVAAVFREINHNVADMRARPVPAKLAAYATDMARWAARLGIRIARPPVYGGGSAPLNSARALRGAFVAIDAGRISAYAEAVFRAYWEELRDVSDAAVLAELAACAGLDPHQFALAVEGRDCRERLAANTDELIARGGFGTPTFFVGGAEMFFGNDRLDFVREALLRQ